MGFLVSMFHAPMPDQVLDRTVKVEKRALNDTGALLKMAEPTGLEPATSDVTGRRSNQLNYDSAS
jgi:hypothetical protein